MYLKSIEIQGFKSFPDKTALNFNKGMTAVVGPNGAGKSNISDAVRWVLGEQSSRSLRSSRMEDVIFSGTLTRRPQGYAEVTLRLDNTDRSLNFDADTVSVTRRYFRSGESEYILGGSTVRLKDIHEIFMDTGLGRDGYSMVGQGSIEDIVSSKSGERREMFEEAAGISQFRYRRQDALRRLEQAEDNLLRLRDILSELEGRVGPLREQSRKAEKFIVLASDKKELEIGLWLHGFDKAAATLREFDNRKTIVETRLDETAAELEKIYADTESAAENAKDITLKVEEIRKNAAVFEESAAAIEAAAAVDRNSIEHNNERIERIGRDKGQEDDIEKHLFERMEDARQKISSLEAEIGEKQKALRDMAAGLEEIQSSGDKVSDSLSAFLKEQAGLLSSLSEKKIALSSAETALSEIEGRSSALASEIERKNRELEALNAKVAEIEGGIRDCDEKIVSLGNEVSGCEIKVRAGTEKEERLRQELASLKIKAEQKQSRIKLLLEMEKNMEGYTGSVKAVMRESGRGILAGIHGPLSQLISAPGEYSCAIETALGAAIQNIVTNSETDAKRAMYYLRDSNAGRATFLPLSSIKPRDLEEKGLENYYGYINVASHLVSCDQKYAGIVKNLLGRTVVVEDIDCAIKISKDFSHRFKIVTLDGQIINAGGSMTGGSGIRGSGFLSRSNEIGRLKDEAAGYEKEIDSLANAHKTAREELAARAAVLEGTKAELQQAQDEKVRAGSMLELARGQLADARALLERYDEERKTSEARRASYIRIKEDETGSIRGMSSRLEELELEIARLGEGRDELLKKKDELAGKAAQVNIDVTSILKDIEAQKEILESLERRKESHSGRIDELNAEIEEIKRKNGEMEKKIAASEAQCEELRRKAADVRAEIDALAAKREEHEKVSSDLRTAERQKADERAKLGGEQARLAERIETLKKEREEVDRRLFEEYRMTRREAEELGIVIESAAKAAKRLSEIKASIRNLGSVNLAAVEEYKEVSERYEFMRSQIEDTEKSKRELEKLIDELTSSMAVRFRERFALINEKFRECFTVLFSGGDAELILEDESNILECGIEIKAQPPGKNVKAISLLSGGEKGLCAIALLFAMLKVTPAPFCVFDEVEAALDDVNVVRFASFVRRMTGNTQFILITHRRGTMEEADMLYGVTMQEEGVSKLLELKTAEMAKELGLE